MPNSIAFARNYVSVIDEGKGKFEREAVLPDGTEHEDGFTLFLETSNDDVGRMHGDLAMGQLYLARRAAPLRFAIHFMQSGRPRGARGPGASARPRPG